MINAKEAKELVLLRDEEIRKELANIEILIKEAAKNGKYELFLPHPKYKIEKHIEHGGGAYGENEAFPRLTDLQHKIISELQLLNFEIDYRDGLRYYDVKVSWY
jgi:hypothetical protein